MNTSIKSQEDLQLHLNEFLLRFAYIKVQIFNWPKGQNDSDENKHWYHVCYTESGKR